MRKLILAAAVIVASAATADAGQRDRKSVV